ncbi:MAG: pilus assembly protein [Lachnospiraceae bacterium]|nr:pilus assembly protein [Lachnospiraceae bacterium]
MKNRKVYKASLTVEAALAFPVFFFAVMALCCLFLYMEAETVIGEAMLETARSVSVYGDIAAEAERKTGAEGAVGDFLEESSVRMILEENLKDHPIAVNTIAGGLSGISCGDSDFCTDDGCIRLVCSYEFRSPVSGFGLHGIKGSSEIVYRYFTGTAAESLLEEKEQETEKEEETVYKTETGTVYHVRLTCPSLKLHILMTEAGEVAGKRNEYGGKYYPCEKCVSGEAPETVYITTDGDRYHYKLDCSGLKRTITEIRKSEIGSLRPCKRCGEKGD